MTDRIFVLANPLVNALANAKYTNNNPIEYSAVNMPQVQVSMWENVKLADKLEIETTANTAGFTEL